MLSGNGVQGHACLDFKQGLCVHYVHLACKEPFLVFQPLCTAKKDALLLWFMLLYNLPTCSQTNLICFIISHVEVDLTVKLLLQWKVRETNTTNKSRQTGSKSVFLLILPKSR